MTKLIKIRHNPGVEVHTFDPTTQEVAGRDEF